MIFEVGKYYRHTTGEELSVVAEVDTTMYGRTLLAETNNSCGFLAVGSTEDHATNYVEITKEEWMKNFS